MSRIGKKPVTIPAGVTVTVDGTHVTVKGAKGELDRTFSDLLTIKQEGEEVLVTRNDDTTASNAQQGLTRTLINNMVIGVSEGFEKKLELAGVGYRATLKGKDLDLSLGYSHPVVYVAPEGISFEVPDNTHITVKGISKEQVGQVAAEIRSKRPPEPYKGKGIHYEGEHIRRKLGKAAK
jgi:large subunit ribosomal protein L6